MITAPDFKEKQIVFVLCSKGEKFCIRNDNLLVIDKDDNTKVQCTCYRLFLVNIIGNCTMTSVLIQKAKKFGFFVAMYTSGFHLYQVIGANKEGNTLLKKYQYFYDGNELAKLIIKNKIATEYYVLNNQREKSEELKTDIAKIKGYFYEIDDVSDFDKLLAYEGLAAKLYFKNYFDCFEWKGRKPRIKCDPVNSTMDIGYTMLFSFVDAILESFGFDTYVGVLHKQFYMRKSLVCDIVEPFRYLIDKAIRKVYNLGQIKEKDFEIVNGQYKLLWKENSKYIGFLMEPIIENRDSIFRYIQQYYRSFMKGVSPEEFPFFVEGEIKNGSYML